MGTYKNPHYHRDYFRRYNEKRRAYLRARYHRDRSRQREAERRYRAGPTYNDPLKTAARQQRMRTYAKQYRQQHPLTHEQMVKANLRQKLKRHGVEFDWYQQQPQTCAICYALEPGGRGNAHGRWSIDHDPVTNVARGLLCNRCNVGIGFFQDDPIVLEAAAHYVRLHAQNRKTP